MMLSDFIPTLRLTEDVLFGSQGFVLVDARPAYEYVNNQRTDKRVGTKLLGVAPSRRYAKCIVTVAEELDFTKEELDSGMRLTFSDFSASIYIERNSGQYKISAKAAAVLSQVKEGG